MDNIILLILTSVVGCQCANILYAIPFTSKSHYIMLRPIGLELARRGHNVTVLTAFEESDYPPSYHQVMADRKTIWDVTEGGRPNIFTMVDLTGEEFYSKLLWPGGVATTEAALSSKTIQHFLDQDHEFDVVISSMFFQEAIYALAHKYKAPLVLVTTFGNCMRHNIMLRNPLQLATVVHEFVVIKDPHSFLGRLRNFYFAMYEYFWWKFWYIEKQEQLVEKYIKNLPEPVPSLEEIQRNTSLFLMNSHFSYDTPAAYLPNLVQIGGIHIPPKLDSLPKDLETILNNSKEGVIYMSLGTHVRSSELPLEKKNAFLKVLRRLKYTVLWKWEEESLEGKPSNLIIRQWMPQKEILAHPNVKVFISHGGLMGTQEAVYYGVPVIGIPIYADQYKNLLLSQVAGMGRILEYHDVNEENLETALRTVLENNTYRIKAKEMSARFQDRPATSLETAMFWIEYVIRNKGADFMKNPARNLRFVAYHMLDVYAFLVSIVTMSTYIFIKLVKYLTRNINMTEQKVKRS